MKSRFINKALSITVSVSIMAASLQFAGPVKVYADTENSQSDSTAEKAENNVSSDNGESEAGKEDLAEASSNGDNGGSDSGHTASSEASNVSQVAESVPEAFEGQAGDTYSLIGNEPAFEEHAAEEYNAEETNTYETNIEEPNTEESSTQESFSEEEAVPQSEETEEIAPEETAALTSETEENTSVIAIAEENDTVKSEMESVGSEDKADTENSSEIKMPTDGETVNKSASKSEKNSEEKQDNLEDAEEDDASSDDVSSNKDSSNKDSSNKDSSKDNSSQDDSSIEKSSNDFPEGEVLDESDADKDGKTKNKEDNISTGIKEVGTENTVEGSEPSSDDTNENRYPNNQYAVEGYGVVNENRDTSYTIKVNMGNAIDLILTGVNEYIYNKKQSIVTLVQNFLGSNKTIQYMESTAFIDAEKYSIDYENYDSNYCWGATASNMLWISGWAKEVLGYTNEDKIMSDLHDKFYDEAEEPRDAITWLFDNYITHVDVSSKEGSTLGGKAASICISEAFNTYINVAGALNNLASLANVAEQSTAIQCRWMDEDGKVKSGSHWLTAVGVVINEAATNIVDYFKAIILADSDDTPGRSKNAPTSAEESYNQRRDTENIYKICTLETINVADVDYWYIPGYIDGDGTGALITGIESLMNYSNSLKEGITEKYGTKDISKSIELIYSGIMYTYGDSVATPQYTFSEESANVRIGYTNTSGISVENVQVPVNVTIKNAKGVELESKLYYLPVDEISANSCGYFDINIDDMTNNLTAGEYKVILHFNPEDAENKLEEAYYLNNDYVSTWITIEEKSGGGEEEVNIPDEHVPDHSEDSSPNNNSEPVENVPTYEEYMSIVNDIINNNTDKNQDAVNDVSDNSVEESIQEAVTENASDNSIKLVDIKVNDMTEEQKAIIDKALEEEGISKDTIKAIDQMFSQGEVTFFVPDTKIDPANDGDYKVFMAGSPGEFVSAEIDGVKLDLSELKLVSNSANSYRVIFDGKTFKGLKKGTHKLIIHSVRGALPIEITITVL